MSSLRPRIALLSALFAFFIHNTAIAMDTPAPPSFAGEALIGRLTKLFAQGLEPFRDVIRGQMAEAQIRAGADGLADLQNLQMVDQHLDAMIVAERARLTRRFSINVQELELEKAQALMKVYGQRFNILSQELNLRDSMDAGLEPAVALPGGVVPRGRNEILMDLRSLAELVLMQSVKINGSVGTALGKAGSALAGFAGLFGGFISPLFLAGLAVHVGVLDPSLSGFSVLLAPVGAMVGGATGLVLPRVLVGMGWERYATRSSIRAFSAGAKPEQLNGVRSSRNPAHELESHLETALCSDMLAPPAAMEAMGNAAVDPRGAIAAIERAARYEAEPTPVVRARVEDINEEELQAQQELEQRQAQQQEEASLRSVR